MEDEPLSKGLPFAIPNVWHPLPVKDHTGRGASLFTEPEFAIRELDHQTGQSPLIQAVTWELPNLTLEDVALDEDLDSIESLEFVTIQHQGHPDKIDQHLAADVWCLREVTEPVVSSPELKTWEAFQGERVPDSVRTAYLSEAGPRAFDAASSLNRGESGKDVVLPQDVVLRAYGNLVLGRSSVLFQWNPEKQFFAIALPDVSISGLSIDCTASFTEHIMAYASLLRQLRLFADELLVADYPCAAMTALKHCFAEVLDTVDANVTADLAELRTLLQLQHVLRRPKEILDVLEALRTACRGSSTNEETISRLSDCVLVFASQDGKYVALVRDVLVRVSAPWLQSLTSDLGLAEYGTATLPGPAGGATAHAQEDTSLEEHRMDEDSGSNLLYLEDRTLIDQTRINLSMLRQHVPDYATELPRIGVPRSVNNMDDAMKPQERSDDLAPESEVWAGDDAQDAYMERLHHRMSESPSLRNAATMSDLQKCAESTMNGGTGDERDSSAETEDLLNFDLLDRIRPLLMSQSRQINRVLLQHLFGSCQLRRHIEAQRAFHLFGNGEFVSRLSTALFSLDSQSAERRRGVVPTTEPMGLRLGNASESKRWPPASSELRLTLMGVLQDSRGGQRSSDGALPNSSVSSSFSFAIRELPDADIERVLDPTGLYALDFLRLKYNAPPPLDSILTQASMQRYDDIFRQLLRMLRLLHLTTDLRRHLSTAPKDHNPLLARFAWEAHHVVSTVLSHYLDMGIAAPWEVLMHSVDRAEHALDADAAAKDPSPLVSLSDLQALHDRCLETIRGRLYLKRKQEHLRESLDELWTAILRSASVITEDGSPEHNDVVERIAAFRQCVRSLVSLLQALVDKTQRGRTKVDDEDNETEVASMLLCQLNWSRYYSDES